MVNQNTNIHNRFIDITSGISADLTNAIRRVGPVDFNPDDCLPLAHHLCRTVAGSSLLLQAERSGSV